MGWRLRHLTRTARTLLVEAVNQFTDAGASRAADTATFRQPSPAQLLATAAADSSPWLSKVFFGEEAPVPPQCVG
jgi:hypothetical protein